MKSDATRITHSYLDIQPYLLERTVLIQRSVRCALQLPAHACIIQPTHELRGYFELPPEGSGH